MLLSNKDKYCVRDEKRFKERPIENRSLKAALVRALKTTSDLFVARNVG